MKISTKGRYALRMLLDLAKEHENTFVTLKEISSRQEISKKYLEQIVPLLHKSDILESVRGNNGGYKLKRPPQEISLFDILSQTENENHIIHCLEEKCDQRDECLARAAWEDLDNLILDHLKNTSLQSILDHEK